MADHSSILNDSEFKELTAKKNSISIVLTVVELIIYFGFVYLIAFNKPFLASDVSGSITMGLPIGIGVIVLSWLLTGLYVRWANKNYDTMVESIKEKIGG